MVPPSKHEPRVEELGDSAFLVRFAESPAEARRARAFAQRMRSAELQGVVDVVPTASCVAVTFDPRTLPGEGWCDRVETLRRQLLTLAIDTDAEVLEQGRTIEISVWYDGPDLDELAHAHGLERSEVIERHTTPDYRVAFLGFLPGFPYLEGLDPSLATPRLATPRPRVPSGSVGIGGSQTGIYPCASPGGWHLIGRTESVLFDPGRDPPALLAAGDHVRFVEDSAAPKSPTSSPPSLSPIARCPSPTFEVLSPGLLTSIQDLGRPGWGHIGLAEGGAIDREAHCIANWLVGNDENAAALEITLLGPRLLCLVELVVALAGADFELRVDGVPAPRQRPLRLGAGAILEIGRPRHGIRATLAVAGGLAVRPLLGSCSWHALAGLGQRLGRSDRLSSGSTPSSLGAPTTHPFEAPAWAAPEPEPFESTRPVGFVAGPAWAELSAEEQRRFESARWRLGDRADRMALVLEPVSALPFELARAGERPTEPVVFGTIQLPPDGRAVVLLADRQTTGGYPRLGEIAAVERSRLAQLRQGTEVRFQALTRDTALGLAADRETELQRLRLAVGARRRERDAALQRAR